MEATKAAAPKAAKKPRAATTTGTTPAKPQPLRDILHGGPAAWLLAVMWHHRFKNQALAVVVTDKDVEAMRQSLVYTKQEADVTAMLKPGRLIITVVEKGSAIIDQATGDVTSPGNAIRPCESTPEGQAQAEKARLQDALRDRAGELSRALMSDLQAQTMSNETVTDAASVLRQLSEGA